MFAYRRMEFVLVLILFLQIGVYGQCPPDGKYLSTSQATTDSFSIIYPNCTTLEELRLDGEEINDLATERSVPFELRVAYGQCRI